MNNIYEVFGAMFLPISTLAMFVLAITMYVTLLKNNDNDNLDSH